MSKRVMHSVRFTKDKIPQAPFFKGDLYLLWILGSPNSELNYMFIPQHITGNSYHKTATCGGNHATSSAGGIDPLFKGEVRLDEGRADRLLAETMVKAQMQLPMSLG